MSILWLESAKMISNSLFVFCFCTLVLSAACEEKTYKSYKDYKLFTVNGNTNDLEKMKTKLQDIDGSLVSSSYKDVMQLLIDPAILPIFEEVVAREKLNSTLIHNDHSQYLFQEKARPQSRGAFTWNAYYDVDEMYAYLKSVNKANPDSTQLVVGGKSYEKRDILGLRINTGSEVDKPVVFIESGIHAREWITPATTTYFINELLTSKDPAITSLRDEYDWHIFPTVNPDGYHYSFKYERYWRKTRSKSANGCYGADPNRNWDYNWLKHGASNRPCDYQTYGGSSAFSEIETKSLSEYISSLENLQAYIAFHADAQMLLVPYSDSTEHTDNYDDLIKMGKTSLKYGYAVNNEEYSGPATAAEILYKASGGSMDWVRHKLGTPLVFTYELRGRYFQWPPSRIPEQGDEYTQMMVGLFKEAKQLGYFHLEAKEE